MNIAKRILSLIMAAALTCSLLAGCSAQQEEGLALSVCVGDTPDSLDPIYAQEPSDQTILVHLYENLMRLSVDSAGTATVVNGMAKEVEETKNVDGSVTYTFHLRSAEWSDGRDVTAEDFVYAWQRLVNPANQSPYADLLSVVVGYTEARTTGDMTLLQVTAKNHATLEVTLDGSYGWFLTEVCTSPATVPLREDVVQKLKSAAVSSNQEGTNAPVSYWWSDPTALVTNGPYQVEAYDASALTACHNEDYYRNIIGPTSLTFAFTGSVAEAQALYDSKDVDAVWPLSDVQLEELAATEDWSPIPELSTYSVLFNGGSELLSDPLVRQAMHLVIDRNLLAQTAGVTAIAAEGLVSPCVPDLAAGVSFREHSLLLLDNDPALYADFCTQATTLLAEAGYDSGANLGQMEFLYVDEGSNAAVAQALCAMWQTTLELQVTPLGVSEAELWTALRSGEYDLAAVSLEPLCNDPEWFLQTWESSHADNVISYQNSAFDTLMKIIATAEDGTARTGCLHDAEALLMDDHMIAPLYTMGTAWKMRETLMGGYRDARGWFSFADVIPYSL